MQERRDGGRKQRLTGCEGGREVSAILCMLTVRSFDILSALYLRPAALLVILVHGVGVHLAPRLAVGGVNHLDVLVDVDVFGEGRLLGPRREDGLEGSEGLGVERVGELDVEVNNQVAHLVVAVGGHSLAGDDLDGSCEVRREEG